MHLLLAHLREHLFHDENHPKPVFIENDTLHDHPILNITYTSYETRQEKDIIHLGYGRTGVLVYTPTLQEDDNEPWTFANVLSIFHVTVRTASDAEPKTLTVLWVRWMERCTSGLAGSNSRNYTRISFVPWTGAPGNTFDFVDPVHIIRAFHLIPAFNLGRTSDLLDPSIARDPQGDWCAYYANR